MICSVGYELVVGITGARVPSDVYLHGVRRYPTEVASVYPKKGEAAFYKVVRRGKLPPATHRRNVGLWQDGCHRAPFSRCLTSRSQGTLGSDYR